MKGNKFVRQKTNMTVCTNINLLISSYNFIQRGLLFCKNERGGEMLMINFMTLCPPLMAVALKNTQWEIIRKY